jgi:hypothetical protein
VTAGPGDTDRDLVCVGRSEDLASFLTEYDLGQDDVQGLVEVRTPPGTGGRPAPPAYWVHRSLLRSHGEFGCAGDAEALRFAGRSRTRW